jgi:glycosyltransferase involved in cell wall biosynthesis
MFKIMVVLPALNEEKTIGDMLDRISQLEIKDSSINVLVVDDGSTDATKSIALGKGAQVVAHGQNRGVGVAFHSGVKEAIAQQVDILVNIDSDGQFDPQYIPKLVEPIIAGEAEFVTASRFLDKRKIDMPLIKKWGNSQIAKLVSRLSGQKIYDVSCGFRAYSRKAFLNLNLIGDFTYTHEAILALAFKGFVIKEVSVPVRGTREFGKSRVASNLFKYAFNATLIIIRCYRDYKPIMTFGAPGIIMTSVGFLLMTVFVVWSFTRGECFPKSMAFASAFCTLLGFLFFVIALLADMSTRMRIKMEKIIELIDNKNDDSQT